jgi:hypothetical protein
MLAWCLGIECQGHLVSWAMRMKMRYSERSEPRKALLPNIMSTTFETWLLAINRSGSHFPTKNHEYKISGGEKILCFKETRQFL